MNCLPFGSSYAFGIKSEEQDWIKCIHINKILLLIHSLLKVYGMKFISLLSDYFL